MSFFDRIGGYAAELHTAVFRAGWLAVLLLIPGWFAFPFTVQSLLHPLDVVKIDHVLHGLSVPHTATARQLTVALTEVAVIIAALCMWQLIVTVSFYRKAQVFGALLVGGLGNLAWFIGLHGDTSDITGYVIGLTSTAVAIALEMLCEQLGRDFVVGTPSGFHPPI